jgi:hypothetical protein
VYSRRIASVTPLLQVSPTANPAYRILAFVRLVNSFFETDWLSQVPTLTVQLPAANSDPGTFQYAHRDAHLFSGFRHM